MRQTLRVCPGDTAKGTEAITPVVGSSGGASERLVKDAEVVGRM